MKINLDMSEGECMVLLQALKGYSSILFQLQAENLQLDPRVTIATNSITSKLRRIEERFANEDRSKTHL